MRFLIPLQNKSVEVKNIYEREIINEREMIEMRSERGMRKK